MNSQRNAALDFLIRRIDYEAVPADNYTSREYRLAGMRELLQMLGDPGGAMPIVHVAGTKGKGSTCAMTAAILTAAGFRCGLYTSPHLQDLEERFRMDGRPCSADLFSRFRRARVLASRARNG